MIPCVGAPNWMLENFPNKVKKVAQEYKNVPSKNDIEFLQDIFEKTGISLEGYIVDPHGIKKYTKNSVRTDPSTMTDYNRCGF